MLIVSIYPGHDPAICVLNDGEVLVNIELERLTRQRYERGATHAQVTEVLKRVGVCLADADYVVCSVRELGHPENRTDVRYATRPDKAFGEYVLWETCEGVKPTFLRVRHHLAHAALAYYGSNFDTACVLTWDGGGDNANISFGHFIDGQVRYWQTGTAIDMAAAFCRIGFNSFRMRPASPHDIGSPAGKLMALAAFGEVDPEIRRQIDVESALFRYVQHPKHAPGLIFNDGEDLSDTTTQRSRAVAASLQDLTEEYVEQLFASCRRFDPELRNVCFAGGVAMNCVANTRAFRNSGIEGLYVPPAPGDGGLALGQALLAHHHAAGLSRDRSRRISAYNGPIYSRSEIDSAVRQAELPEAEFDVRDAGVAEVAKLVVDGHVVALFRGRSESGPRALGHRSLIARPDRPGMRDYLNDEVKFREYYRPVAPIVLAAHADSLMETPFPYSPYMATTATIREEWRERLTAVCHVDNSTRPQVLEPADEPWLHDLLERVYDATGIPAVVNTSFNRREPIVESPSDAIRTFREMPIAALYLDGVLIRRPGFTGDRDATGD